QAGVDIPAAGTTHGDYFYGNIPNTRQMNEKEIKEAYEKNTGSVIIETFEKRNISPDDIPGVLVNDHGQFTWGNSHKEAVYHSVIYEYVVAMAYHTKQNNSNNIEIKQK